MKQVFLVINLICCLVGFSGLGCKQVVAPTPQVATPRAIAGEYAFQYWTGEIEVVSLYQDMAYRQEFYRDLVSYQTHSTPMYLNTNVWSHTVNSQAHSIRAHLSLVNWPDARS